MKNTLFFCKTNYCNSEGIFQTGRYSNGRLGIVFIDHITGEPLLKITVNVPEIQIMENEIIIKDYSENEGVARWLIDEKLVEPEFRTEANDFVFFLIFKITDKFKQVLDVDVVNL